MKKKKKQSQTFLMQRNHGFFVFPLTEAGSHLSWSDSREPSWTPSLIGHVCFLTDAKKGQEEGDTRRQHCCYV